MMFTRTSFTALALAIPVVVLSGITGYKTWDKRFNTQEVHLKVYGYDPRDILSGYYILYRVDYGFRPVCPEGSLNKEGYVCLSTKSFSYEKPGSCKLYIHGRCDSLFDFSANIERFYIPEKYVSSMPTDIISENTEVVLEVNKQGDAYVKDLLYKNRPVLEEAHKIYNAKKR